MNEKTIQTAIKSILDEIDSMPNREGLDQTPQRYADFAQKFLNPGPFKMTVFENEGYDEMVIQREIVFYSLCEHHLLPFFGTGTIAYLPGKKIVGLSKLARTLDSFSRRLQNQERITSQVADHIVTALQPKGVGVILRARHLCIEMRGIQKPGSETITSALRGKFKDDTATRAEFMNLASI